MLVDNGFARPEYTSCGKNAVVYYGQIEAMLNGRALTWEQRVADLASKQPEHSWDEKYATKVGYTGWDMLGLGCNVLVGGRYKAGPPVLIPGGGTRRTSAEPSTTTRKSGTSTLALSRPRYQSADAQQMDGPT